MRREVAQRVGQHDARPAGVIGNDIALVGHLAAVLEVAAAAQDALGEVEFQQAEDGRKDMDQQIGGRPAGIVPIHPPLEEPRRREIPLGGIAQQLFPIEAGPGPEVGIGDRHPLAPIAAAEIARLHVDDLADDPFLR